MSRVRKWNKSAGQIVFALLNLPFIILNFCEMQPCWVIFTSIYFLYHIRQDLIRETIFLDVQISDTVYVQFYQFSTCEKCQNNLMSHEGSETSDCIIIK